MKSLCQTGSDMLRRVRTGADWNRYLVNRGWRFLGYKLGKA